MARIFIIDDDPMIIRFIETVLTEKGHRCRGYEDSARALAEIEEGESRPDLVLLDLVMPGAGGLEVLARLRKIAPALPIIVSTSSERQDDVIAALRGGADNFIKKPLESELLETAVRRALEQAVVIRQNAELLEKLRRQNEDLRNYRATIDKELALAWRVQEWMMKVNFRPMKRFAFHHHHVAAAQVTGDFVDALTWDDGRRQGILFVDISGHGVSAALMAPIFRLIARQCLATCLPPSAALAAIGRQGKEFFGDGRFASLLYVLLDDETSTATIAKGGQEPALLLRRAASAVEEINPEGYPIGMDLDALLGEEATYQEVRVELKEGDRLFLYSDGIVEAGPRAHPDASFGRERLARFLVNTGGWTAKALSEKLFDDVLVYTGARHFLDDSTLAVIEARTATA